MINADEVKKIAHLARLELTEEELEPVKNKLNSILGCIEQLQEVDIQDLEPMSHAHGAVNVFRADECSGTEDPAAILHNAPDRSGSFIRVPLIIEQEFES